MTRAFDKKILAGSVLLWLSVGAMAQNSSFVCTGIDAQNLYNASTTYLGCYTDAVERTLDGKQITNAKNDAESCANSCGYLGFKYSATVGLSCISPGIRY
jgi:beta-D-xylosidase 4